LNPFFWNTDFPIFQIYNTHGCKIFWVDNPCSERFVVHGTKNTTGKLYEAGQFFLIFIWHVVWNYFTTAQAFN